MNAVAMLVVALAAAVGWPASAGANRMRIQGFEFSCVAPGGETVKPVIGDIGDYVLADTPGQDELCLATISRKLALCRANTEFDSSSESHEFATCLPAFEEQSRACVAHFERERVKCRFGDDPAVAAEKESYTVDPVEKVMVVTLPANARTGPDPGFSLLDTLDAGMRVRVTGRARGLDWFRIDLRMTGEEAFVHARLLKELAVPGEAGPASVGQDATEARTQGDPEKPAPEENDLPTGRETEAALELSFQDRSLIQWGLSAQGFDPGPADGVFGPRTRAALRAWQEKNEMAVTGYLTSFAAVTLKAAGKAGREAGPPAALKPFGPNWIVVENQPCQIWNPYPIAGETVTWTGGCVDGKVSGKGRTIWKNSNGTSTHEGERWQGKRYGWGIVVEADGDRFEGEFRNNRAHGQGTFTWTDGRRYEGEWRNGKPHGRGTFTEPDGDRFEGKLDQGLLRQSRWTMGSCLCIRRSLRIRIEPPVRPFTG